MQRDLVLTLAKGYTYPELHIFLESLRRVGYRGDIVVFVEEHTGRNTMRAIRRKGAIPIFYSEAAIPYAPFGRTIDRPIHLNNYRHFLYHQYLTARLHELRYVMLSDARDVYFQQDPFARGGGDELRFALEDQTIEACPVNSGWLRVGYDENVVTQIGANQISCAGTVVGPARRVHEYVTLMIGEIFHLKDPYACADQAAHNYLIYSGRIADCRLEDNQTGRIWTMAYGSDRASENGRYFNSRGEEFVALHQYHRHARISREIHHRFFGSVARRKLIKAVYKVLK